MRIKSYAPKCILGVVVVALFLGITWSATAARLSTLTSSFALANPGVATEAISPNAAMLAPQQCPPPCPAQGSGAAGVAAFKAACEACGCTDPATTCNGDFTIDLQSTTRNGDLVTFTYQICDIASENDLSHAVFELDFPCLGAGKTLADLFDSCSPGCEIGLDPTTQVLGIKFNTGGPGPCYTLSFTLDESALAPGFTIGTGCIVVATKAGDQDIRMANNPTPGYACAIGPVCVEECGTCAISGPDGPVCPGSKQTFTAPITGACDDPVYKWTVTGDGMIVGDDDGPSVMVMATDCGEYTVRSEISCTGCTPSPIVCEKTISVVDNVAPVLSGCPSPTASFQCFSQVPDPPTVTAVDNCLGTVPVTFTQTQTNPGSSCNNVITRTWTATDSCGNTATCTQTITVNDTTLPQITCPPNTTVECGASTDPAATGTATAEDNCGPVDISHSDAFAPGCGNTGVITRTWTAEDACGNKATCVQTITIEDETPPVLTACPSDITACDGEPVTFTPPTATDACEGSVPVVCTPSGPFPLGMTTVTCTAADDCGNTASCSFKVTVNPNPTCTLEPPDPLPGCGTTNNTLTAAPGFITYKWTIMTATPGWVFTGGNGSGVVISPDGLMLTGTGTNEVQYSTPPQTSSATFILEVTDANGCKGTCEVTFNCLEPQVEFCSLTQGFYGNLGGKFNGLTAAQIMEAILAQGSIVIGKPGRSLTLEPGDSACIIRRMPAGGPAAILPAGNLLLDANCNTSPAIPTDKKGKWRNVLLGQVVALSFNVRLHTIPEPDGPFDLGSFELCETIVTHAALPGPDGALGTNDDVMDPGPNGILGDDDDPVLTVRIPLSVLCALDALGLPRTVNGLLELANRALGGQPTGGASLSDINKAVDAINRGFDECRFVVSCESGTPCVATNRLFRPKAGGNLIAGIRRPFKSSPFANSPDLIGWLTGNRSFAEWLTDRKADFNSLTLNRYSPTSAATRAVRLPARM